MNKQQFNKPVLCILGPTASGKSGLAETIASTIPSELINVDSAQVFCDLNIGSAKPDAQTQAAIPHHLIDIRKPFETYSASEFVHDATCCIKEIQSRNKLPILVGGTMLYFKALFDGLADLPAADVEVRKQLEQEANEKGWGVLHQDLSIIDPIAAARIKPTDTQRIQRALEVYRITDKPITYWHEQQKRTKSEFNFIKVALIPKERSVLHQRIEQRFHLMMEQGFKQEVEQLSKRLDFERDSSAMRSVGYRQLLCHVLDGEDEHESVQKGIYATRQLAKRQLTWLRKMTRLCIFDPFTSRYPESALGLLHNQLKDYR